MYRIPTNKEVGRFVLAVLKEHKAVGSQKLLHFLVLSKLRKENQFYKLSPERVKRVAAGMPGVKVFVEKRKSAKDAGKCFICGYPLEKIKVRDLFGNPTYIGKKCMECGFKIDKPSLAPRRYLFRSKG